MYSCNAQIEKNTIIILCGGSGKRMNLENKKQYLEFLGRPMFMNSVIVSENCNLIDEIIIVTSPEDIKYVEEQCELEKISKVKTIVCGGKERQNSVMNALKSCSDGIILIHDGVRPFIKEEYILVGINYLKKNEDIDGVVIGVKTKDTIKIVNDENIIIKTLKREELINAQTPQIFRSEILKKAYLKSEEIGLIGTDDSSLIEKIGGKIKVLNGDYENIKITTIDDLKYLRNL